MNTCRECGTTRPIEEFSISKGKPSNLCRPCKREYDNSYHAARTPEAKQRKMDLQEARKDILRKNLWEYKLNHPCVDCGESDPIVLEFDHTDIETKEHTICDMIKSGRSWEMILKEISKCVVRCANCHRRRTFTQFGWYGRV